ncbi:MAG: 1-acyl-sn-glycerol-3-phosphate acyltransferase [Clostridiales bacterium]|jgi:1-acyl-sn-glycerol-3-phosphate acyltransferase|nr:1-acyl-sn-glycerol-3-phosphate acyltransferase [Clostridiales bacterium]
MLYTVGRAIVWVWFHAVYRLRVTGLENIPSEGGAIICSNHVSAADPIALGVVVRRKIVFLAKKELFRNRIAAWALRKLGAIEIDRGASDIKAFRAGVKSVKGGRLLGIFIQGHRMYESGLAADQAKGGAALFANRTGAPVVPVLIRASYRPFSRVFIDFGKPVDFSDWAGGRVGSAEISAMAERIMSDIINLGNS